MTKHLFQVVLLGVVAFGPKLMAQSQPASNGVPVHMVVTVEARKGNDVPEITREDVKVYQGKEKRPTLDWVPLRGEHAGMEFFILIDDGLTTSVGTQLDDIRQFINGQPATTAIGVAYMRDGTAQVVQNPTTDHAQAAKALRLPIGEPGINASPYFSVTDLIKRWPAQAVRRETLLVTDGVDRFYGGSLNDPYVDEAVTTAQKAGVIIYSIYYPGVGHYGRSYWRVSWAQNYLSQLSEETGGESFYMGFGPPVSFSPYLEQLSRRLEHQYLLSFAATPEKKNSLQKVKLRTEVPNAELIAADAVYVPAMAQ
jgi:hypothetical protein